MNGARMVMMIGRRKDKMSRGLGIPIRHGPTSGGHGFHLLPLHIPLDPGGMGGLKAR